MLHWDAPALGQMMYTCKLARLWEMKRAKRSSCGMSCKNCEGCSACSASLLPVVTIEPIEIRDSVAPRGARNPDKQTVSMVTVPG